MTITHAKYSADGSVTAGPIEGQTWSGITEASRFWPMVQEWVDAGNVIEDYVPTTIKLLTKPLDRLVFWLVAASAGVSKWSVRARIAAMPETTPEEFLAKAETIAWFEEAPVYRRDDPILVAMSEAEGITSEQLDALWAYAVTN